jgi:hypothetical protein
MLNNTKAKLWCIAHRITGINGSLMKGTNSNDATTERETP